MKMRSRKLNSRTTVQQLTKPQRVQTKNSTKYMKKELREMFSLKSIKENKKRS